MSAFIIRRSLLSVFVVLAVSFVVFILTFLSGDPAVLMVSPNATAEDIEQFREQAGFNDPLLEQYWRFLSNAVKGDFGVSLRHHQPTLPMVLERLPITFQLSLFAMGLTIITAVPLGVISAVKRGSVLDAFTMSFAVFGQSMPNFWLGILLIMFFSVRLRLLPSFGQGTFGHLILPGATIALNQTATIARLVRSNLLDVLSADYIRTARGKGLAERVVLFQHALRNSMIPVVTVIGLQFGYILGGAVVIETVFSWPGVGLLVVNAIYNRDFPLVQAAVFVLSVLIVLINVLVDILTSVLDPRIRLGDS